MRRLQIHWLSLPKGNPDDNPTETVFSGLQREVIAGSNAADTAEQKRCISHSLQRRNRKKDRFIRLGYLKDFYNQ